MITSELEEGGGGSAYPYSGRKQTFFYHNYKLFKKRVIYSKYNLGMHQNYSNEMLRAKKKLFTRLVFKKAENFYNNQTVIFEPFPPGSLPLCSTPGRFPLELSPPPGRFLT